MGFGSYDESEHQQRNQTEDDDEGEHDDAATARRQRLGGAQAGEAGTDDRHIDIAHRARYQST